MPGGDGTGPLGLGARTGWGLGYCSGYSIPGSVSPYGFRSFGFGRGVGRSFGWRQGGFGMGRGFWRQPAAGSFGYSYYPSITPKQEADMLKDEAKAMQDEISAIEKRIAELESKTKTQEKEE